MYACATASCYGLILICPYPLKQTSDDCLMSTSVTYLQKCSASYEGIGHRPIVSRVCRVDCVVPLQPYVTLRNLHAALILTMTQMLSKVR